MRLLQSQTTRMALVAGRQGEFGVRPNSEVTQGLSLVLNSSGGFSPAIVLSRQNATKLIVFDEKFATLSAQQRSEFQEKASVSFLQEDPFSQFVFVCVDFEGNHLEKMLRIAELEEFIKLQFFSQTRLPPANWHRINVA